VFLFAHAIEEPPIGRVTRIVKVGAELRGTVEYADADTYPFADTIFRLVKGGYLNATSVAWMPLEWKWAAEKDRPGGIDFTKQELLEISQVPVPALPSALVTARAAGIDTRPIYEWAEKILDSGDKIAIPRSELEELRRAAKMPEANKSAEPSRLPQTNKRGLSFSNLVRREGPFRRELAHVAWLAMCLQELGFIKEALEDETVEEDDEGLVAGIIHDGIQKLGEALVQCAAEEVAELLGGDALAGSPAPAPRSMLRRLADLYQDAREPLDRYVVEIPGQISPDALRSLQRSWRQWRSDPKSLLVLAGGVTMREIKAQRTGRVLSQENETTLRKAHEHLCQARDLVHSVVSLVGEGDDTAEPKQKTEDPETARQVAIAKLRKISGS
jgi:HK97 family phage prohead protease